MVASYNARRWFRLHTLASLDLSQTTMRATRKLAFTLVSLFRLSSTSPSSDTAAQNSRSMSQPAFPADMPTNAHGLHKLSQLVSESRKKQHINLQIPVKPTYIACRNPIVLCHGLYGYDVKDLVGIPAFQIHYWRGIREALEQLGTKVYIARMPSKGEIRERALRLHAMLKERCARTDINIVGHSMGGLDARYLITHVGPTEYRIKSLTTISTPHRGSPFMDWCRDYLGLGKIIDPEQLVADFSRAVKSGSSKADQSALMHNRISQLIRHAVAKPLPKDRDCQAVRQDVSPRDAMADIDPYDERLREFARFLMGIMSANPTQRESSQLALLSTGAQNYLTQSTSLLGMLFTRLFALFDAPAYACLTTDYCKNFFNPSTPNSPDVEYFSYSARADTQGKVGAVSRLRIPHDIIYKKEGPNDGLVSVASAKWGKHIETLQCDHFDLTNRWKVGNVYRDALVWLNEWQKWWSSWEWMTKTADKAATPTGASLDDLSPNVLRSNENEPADKGLRATKEFDVVEFYLRVSTMLHREGY